MPLSTACWPATRTLTIIVCSFCDSVEELFDPVRQPSVEQLRPSSCPLCGELAFSPGKRFGIVGHGTYQRQVLGVVEAAEKAITLVRRYFCRGCERTINIPRRANSRTGSGAPSSRRSVDQWRDLYGDPLQHDSRGSFVTARILSRLNDGIFQ